MSIIISMELAEKIAEIADYGVQKMREYSYTMEHYGPIDVAAMAAIGEATSAVAEFKVTVDPTKADSDEIPF